jgi:hypothetical protein
MNTKVTANARANGRAYGALQILVHDLRVGCRRMHETAVLKRFRLLYGAIPDEKHAS